MTEYNGHGRNDGEPGFGPADHHPDGMNDYDIARAMGVSRSRVYQIRTRALRKIRRALLNDPAGRALIADVCGLSIEAVESLAQRIAALPRRARMVSQ